MPEPQKVHTSAEVPPGAAEKVPAGQGRHALAPTAALYQPGAHREQEVAPAALNAPAVHGWHTEELVAPLVALDVPAGQGLGLTVPYSQ